MFRFAVIAACVVSALAGYAPLTARTGANFVGTLRHPSYPYNSVDASGRLLGRSGISNSIYTTGNQYTTSNIVDGGNALVGRFNIPSTVNTIRTEVPATRDYTLLTGRYNIPSTRISTVNTNIATPVVNTVRTFAPAVNTLEARVNIPTRSIITEQVNAQVAVPQIDPRTLFPAINPEPIVVNEQPEVIHEETIVVPGTEQNINAGGQTTQTQTRSEENREINRNQELNTYSVRRDLVNRFMNNLQRVNLHRHRNTNINTNIRRINNQHVENEIINNVQDTIQPEELIYVRRINRLNTQEEVRPTQSFSERTVNLGTEVVPGESRVVADEVIPVVQRGVVDRQVLPVRTIASNTATTNVVAPIIATENLSERIGTTTGVLRTGVTNTRNYITSPTTVVNTVPVATETLTQRIGGVSTGLNTGFTTGVTGFNTGYSTGTTGLVDNDFNNVLIARTNTVPVTSYRTSSRTVQQPAFVRTNVVENPTVIV